MQYGLRPLATIVRSLGSSRSRRQLVYGDGHHSVDVAGGGLLLGPHVEHHHIPRAQPPAEFVSTDGRQLGPVAQEGGGELVEFAGRRTQADGPKPCPALVLAASVSLLHAYRAGVSPAQGSDPRAPHPQLGWLRLVQLVTSRSLAS
jgi:hypothetical protein